METSSEGTTVTSGSSDTFTTGPAAASLVRAGMPARTTSPAKTAAPASASAPTRARLKLGTRSELLRERMISPTGRAAHTRAREASTATLVANSVVCGAMSSTATSAIATEYTRLPVRLPGIVFGSVIMKKRKTRISGEKTSTRQNSQPVIGPRCQRAVMAWPLAASTAMPTANASQKHTAIASSRRRERITRPPTTMIASASAIQADIGPHQNSSGSARLEPRIRNARTRPKFDGLKTWRPRKWIRYLERSATAEVAAKIHQPCMLHQSPCSVPGTRRMNATPLPVRSALAGHMSTCWRRKAMPTSSTAQVSSETRICAIERRNSNATCPSTCSETMTAAR